MRNLKRILSLTLATAMLFGMMVMGASAADKKPLTDLDKVTNKEAVNLMVDLGIIVGKPDGSFAPTETVDRATMAKLITYIMMGDVDQSTFAGTTTALKDIDNNWAEGYIKYCFANGIISGDGTNFYPAKSVTTVEAAKMLLVALGYDAATQGYVNNASWSVNIMRDAQKAGLTAGVSAKAGDGLTRDNAAQMLCNGLMAKTVTNEYTYDNGTKYVSKVSTNPTTLGLETYGLVKVVGKVNTSTTTTTTISGNTEPKFNRGYEISVPGSVGKTITLYAKFDYVVSNNNLTYGNYKGLVSAQASMVSSTVLGTNAKGTTFAKLTDSDETAYIAALDDGSNSSATVEFYYNGSKLNSYATVALAWGTAVAGSTPATGLGQVAGNAIVAGEPVNVTAVDASTSLLGNGVVVSFIDNDSNGKADVVDISAYTAAKVTSYATKDKGTVSFNKTIGDSTSWAGDKVIGFADIAKDDFVTATASNGKVTVTKADTVEGKITSKNSSKSTIVVDGNTYELAANKVSALTIASFTVGDEVILALDPTGYIIATGAAAAVTNDKYIYVINSDAGTMAGRQAKVAFSDGTTSVVTIAKIDGAAATGSSNINGAYTFTLKDSKYTLSAKLGTDLQANDTTGTVKYTAKKGIATATATGTTSGGTAATPLTGKYANNATLFVDTVNGKVFTGYNALPGTLDFTGGTIVYDSSNASLMRIVYMSAGIASSTGSKDEIVIADTRANESQDADGNPLYTYTAIVNGEKKDVVLDASAFATVSTNTGIYTIETIDTDGVITKLALKGTAAFADKAAVTSFAADTLVYAHNTSTVLTVNEDTIYIEVNTTKRTVEVVGSGNVATEAPFDSIIVTTVGTTANTAEASTAQYVYIIK